MDKSKLLLLFERPQEPIFTLKGEKKNTAFLTPPSYLNDKHRPYADKVVTRFGESAQEQVVVPEISIPPMDDIEAFPMDAAFSLFIDRHRELAARLIEIFVGVRNSDDLTAVAIYAREHVNPQLFNYAFSVALLHRPDTQNLPIPSVVRSFPDKFIENNVIGRAREEGTIIPDELRDPIVIPKDYTASDLEDEHRLYYFREDLGVNLHHWHWHQVYPGQGPRSVVDKNRRGELFFYMHQQIIARYNFERLANRLKRVAKLDNWDAEIQEAYFPKLDRLVSSRQYAGRVANTKMLNLNRIVDGSRVDIQDLKSWRDAILKAIIDREVVDAKGKKQPLTEFGGIDILGNLIEATDLSVNKRLYGNLHNQGHNIISLIHDPDARHLEESGVMGDVATAMRDPIFYRWHAYIDSILQTFKDSLPEYPVNKLNHPGIEVAEIKIKAEGSSPNVLGTFWQTSDVNIADGLDFLKADNIYIRLTLLQHANFQYEITVNNTSKANKQGTCRIFLSPKFDERGNPWRFVDQKSMFIEMDKFTVNLKQGTNKIVRMSTESSVTIPFERTYRDRSMVPTDEKELAQWRFCGCGWPHNLLVPRGTPEGMPCELFVMISSYDDDKVDQDNTGVCNDAYSYCGIKDKLYPDKRSMGYPFDRRPRGGVKSLQDFLTPNMRVQDITIKFENKVVPRTT